MRNKVSAFLWDFIKKFKWEIIVFYSRTIISDLLYLILAGYFLNLITNKAKSGNFENLVLYGIFYCFLLTNGYLNRILNKRIEYKVRKKLDRYYVLRFFGRTLKHEMSYFSNNLTGQLTSKIFNIQAKLEHIFGWSIDLITNMFTFFVGLGVFYFIDPKLTYFGLLWIAIYIPTIVFLFKWNFRVSDESSEKITKSVGLINDCFINIMNIKIFSNERREFRQIKKQSVDILRSEGEKMLSQNILHIFDYVASSILSFGLFAISFIGFMNGKINIGTMLFTQSYAFQIIFWVNQAIRVAFEIVSDVAIINNSIDTLLIEPKIKDKKDAAELNDVEGRIVFRNILFSYENK